MFPSEDTAYAFNVLFEFIDLNKDSDDIETEVALMVLANKINRFTKYSQEKHQCSCDCPACYSCSYSE